jgi:hypothetical protein
MISSYKTTTNCVICSDDVQLVWFFFFPRFWLGIDSVYALNWCRMSHDISFSWSFPQRPVVLLVVELTTWCLGCLWTSLLLEVWRIFLKCLGHSDNGFLWLKFLLMIEVKLLFFLDSCPLTQPAKSKHKISSIMGLLVFLDLRSCQVNGTLPRQFSGDSVTNLVGKISLKPLTYKSTNLNKMHNETILDFQVQMTIANGNPTIPLHHIALFYKDFPNNNIRKLDCQRHYKK